jgi:RNA polymerase sigma-70 factor (ECF subfamily)
VADLKHPADLIQNARNGDPSAFEELVRPHLDSVRRFIFSLTSNWSDADDIAQEALLKAFRSFNTFDERASLSTWLYTVARSTCVDWSRSRIGKVRPHKPLKDNEPAREPSQDELLEEKLNAELLWQAIERLDEKHRVVLVLFDIEGVTYEEIAAIENIPVGTVRSRLSRARSRLHELLNPPQVGIPLLATGARGRG